MTLLQKNTFEKSVLLQALITRTPLGLITDVDGTISPIVSNPDAAQVTTRSRSLLEALAGQLACVAVISGRAAADVATRVGIPDILVIGNHGMERWDQNRAVLSPQAAHYRPAMVQALAALEPLLTSGMTLEDKGATLSVHYRQTSDPDHVGRVLEPHLSRIVMVHGLRLFHGRRVFEIRPPVEIDKGSAFRDLIDEFDLAGALYIGDDTTDVHAFRAAHLLRESGGCFAVSMGVVSEETPQSVLDSADLTVSGVSGVEDLLAWVLKASTASST
jgi:trehalose 6-phosphate phosphatase